MIFYSSRPWLGCCTHSSFLLAPCNMPPPLNTSRKVHYKSTNLSLKLTSFVKSQMSRRHLSPLHTQKATLVAWLSSCGDGGYWRQVAKFIVRTSCSNSLSTSCPGSPVSTPQAPLDMAPPFVTPHRQSSLPVPLHIQKPALVGGFYPVEMGGYEPPCI